MKRLVNFFARIAERWRFHAALARADRLLAQHRAREIFFQRHDEEGGDNGTP